jgi:hypothetical protein
MILAVVSGLLVLSLAVPVALDFRFEGIEPLRGRIAVRWMFGLVRFDVELPDAGKPRRAKRQAERGAKRGRAGRAGTGGRAKVVAVLRQAAFRRRLFRLLGDLVRAAHPSGLGLRLRLGLGDPADTGRLWALVGPLNALAQQLPSADIRIEPEFVDAAFDFDAHGRFVLIPLQLLALIVVFALSPPSIQAWRKLATRHA